jgi:hypothetical protein
MRFSDIFVLYYSLFHQEKGSALTHVFVVEQLGKGRNIHSMCCGAHSYLCFSYRRSSSFVVFSYSYQCMFLEENTGTRSMYSLPVVVCILLVHRYSSLYCELAFYCVVWSKKWATQVSHSLYCGFPSKGMSVSPFDIVHETGSEISSFRCALGEGPLISMLSVH